MNIKKLTLACLLAGLSATTHAAPYPETPTSPQAIVPCNNGTGSNCNELINLNTASNQIFNFNIYDYMRNQLGFGLADFDKNLIYQNQAQAGTITPVDINTGEQNVNDVIIETTYLASRFFIRNLPIASVGFANAKNLFTISYDEGLNTINQEQVPEVKELANNDGKTLIKNLDIPPFSYPRSSQLIRNSLSSVPIATFLNALKSSSKFKKTDLATEVQTKTKDLCVATKSDNSNNIAGIAGNALNAGTTSYNSFCPDPFIQLNTASGSYGTSTAGEFNTEMPGYYTFLRQTSDPKVLPSLSADTLLSPLTYNEQMPNESNNSSTDNLGLYGRTELASADNFIRYLSGELIPNTISTDTEYNLYKDLANFGVDGDESLCSQYPIDAAMKIKVYRTMLRGYAAQESVGTSNLYHLMQKRRSVPTGQTHTSNTKNTSQMEEEYNMATYRIFNPDGSGSTAKETLWQANLKQASSAAIQKQMALLLAEINYQLFLNRKEQERILLTLSAMQLGQNAQQKKQLTLSSAASYVSTIQSSQITPTTECQILSSSQ